MTRLWCVFICADSKFFCCKSKYTVTVPVAECCRRTTWNYSALLLSVIICGYLTFGARPRWAITEDFNDTLPMNPHVDLCAVLCFLLLCSTVYSNRRVVARTASATLSNVTLLCAARGTTWVSSITTCSSRSRSRTTCSRRSRSSRFSCAAPLHYNTFTFCIHVLSRLRVS